MSSALAIIRKYHPNVTSIQDAKAPIVIEVQKEDVKLGRGKSPEACAMARAACRRLHYDGAIISLGVAYLIKGDKATRYLTPPSVARELVTFDRHHTFAVGSYRLSAPPKSQTFKAMHKPRKHGPNHPSGKGKRHHTTGVRAL